MLTVDAECSQPTPVAERPRPVAAVSDEHPTFEQVVEQHQPNVARLARRLLGWTGANNDVDDVVQDVFLAVLKGFPRFRGHSTISTWITRITINACRSHRRRRIVRLAFLERFVRRAPASQHEPEPPADERDETSRRVRRAVSELPNRYREIVVLRYLQEMEIDEIRQVLGASRGAIEVRLHRARAMLKDALDDAT